MKVKDISEIQIRKVINDLQQSIATKNMCITIITKVLAYAVSPYRILIVVRAKILSDYTSHKRLKSML